MGQMRPPAPGGAGDRGIRGPGKPRGLGGPGDQWTRDQDGQETRAVDQEGQETKDQARLRAGRESLE